MIIDVRTPDLFKRGSMPGAKNVPLRHLQKELLLAHRQTQILFVHDDIATARIAQSYAESMGFANVKITVYKRQPRGQ